jgi:hypothetical protein
MTMVQPRSPDHGLGGLRKDIRHALRLIVRQPGHAALVVTTLALGLAAVTVLAAIAYGVLLKPLPWADARGWCASASRVKAAHSASVPR